MTESEWLQSTNAHAMLWHLEVTRRVLQFKAGRRKARLLACAWCRPLLARLPGDWGAGVVELAEGFADGRISKEDLAAVAEFARENAMRVYDEWHRAGNPIGPGLLSMEAARAVSALARESSPSMLSTVHGAADGAPSLDPSLPPLWPAIREVFGNPFRPAAFDPAWRRRNDGAARRLAETIYENRAFGEAPVLADALLDAGCTDEALLGHLRGEGPHVRGCWAIDLVLGRELRA